MRESPRDGGSHARHPTTGAAAELSLQLREVRALGRPIPAACVSLRPVRLDRIVVLREHPQVRAAGQCRQRQQG
jgi:hypothetical protein